MRTHQEIQWDFLKRPVYSLDLQFLNSVFFMVPNLIQGPPSGGYGDQGGDSKVHGDSYGYNCNPLSRI